MAGCLAVAMRNAGCSPHVIASAPITATNVAATAQEIAYPRFLSGLRYLDPMLVLLVARTLRRRNVKAVHAFGPRAAITALAARKLVPGVCIAYEVDPGAGPFSHATTSRMLPRARLPRR